MIDLLSIDLFYLYLYLSISIYPRSFSAASHCSYTPSAARAERTLCGDDVRAERAPTDPWVP